MVQAGKQHVATCSNAVDQAIWSRQTLEIASNGSLFESKGTFGPVLAQGTQEIWEIAGPVDCNPNTAESKSLELAGYGKS